MGTMRILIIEDNRFLAQSIKDHFSDQFVIDLAYTGKEGLEKADAWPYTVLVLDLQLPDQSGKDVCETLRKRGYSAPILILTADSSTSSCVELLNAGADDYLVKPFKPKELGARISALARRHDRSFASDTIRINDLVINTAKRQVKRGDTAIPLRRKEFDILAYLAKNRGRAVTREMIIDHTWESGKDGWSNSVDVHIKYLRDKIDRPFNAPPVIKTAYGIGYMVDDADD
jgi:DNA-binding response OmpR family regulator